MNNRLIEAQKQIEDSLGVKQIAKKNMTSYSKIPEVLGAIFVDKVT